MFTYVVLLLCFYGCLLFCVCFRSRRCAVPKRSAWRPGYFRDAPRRAGSLLRQLWLARRFRPQGGLRKQAHNAASEGLKTLALLRRLVDVGLEVAGLLRDLGVLVDLAKAESLLLGPLAQDVELRLVLRAGRSMQQRVPGSFMGTSWVWRSASGLYRR